MKVFLSHAVAAQDADLPARLRAIAASYGIQILLPDRTGPQGIIEDDLSRKLAEADHVLVLVTKDAPDHSAVNREVAAVTEAGLSISPIIEDKAMSADCWMEDEIVEVDRCEESGAGQPLCGLAMIVEGLLTLASYTGNESRALAEDFSDFQTQRQAVRDKLKAGARQTTGRIV